jgi:hypothetical protein
MGGKAKKSPPPPGPNFLAIRPVAAVINPPKRKRTANSYQRFFPGRRNQSQFASPGYFSQPYQSPKATPAQTGSEEIVTQRAKNRPLIRSQLTQEAYTKNAMAPAIMDPASVAAK